MNEAKKTNELRGPDFLAQFMNGKVIDIGAGPDLVCDWAERFDIEDGDANCITKYRQAGTYDAVHSSHCLEHMHDPQSALSEWWDLLKPGGYLVTVVPNEDLYEQGIWPSIFNLDHKSTFRLGNATSWSPRSFDVREIHSDLPGAHIIRAEVQDAGYDYSLQRKYGDTRRPIRGAGRILRLSKKVPFQNSLGRWLRKLAFHSGVTIDQTDGPALAQIQVVARKGP
jgi:SAM-dependent methyltransferase